jgi:hypothetical protein
VPIASCLAEKPQRETIRWIVSAPWPTLPRKPRLPCGISSFSLSSLAWYVCCTVVSGALPIIHDNLGFSFAGRDSSWFHSHCGHCCSWGCIQESSGSHYYANHQWYNRSSDGQIPTPLPNYCRHQERAGGPSMSFVAWNPATSLLRLVSNVTFQILHFSL